MEATKKREEGRDGGKKEGIQERKKGKVEKGMDGERGREKMKERRDGWIEEGIKKARLERWKKKIKSLLI